MRKFNNVTTVQIRLSMSTCYHINRLISIEVSVNFGVTAVDLFSGMSALQCAAVALKTNMSVVKGSMSPDPSRLQTLRQEYMRETLECLLQMGSYQHTTVCPSAPGKNLLPDLLMLI